MSLASRTKNVHFADMEENRLVQFKLMLPADLKLRVEAAAKDKRRSLSQEIVAALEEKFPSPQQLEELFSTELVEWSNKIADAKSDDEADAIMDEANYWLEHTGLKKRFVLFRLEGHDNIRIPGLVPEEIMLRELRPDDE